MKILPAFVFVLVLFARGFAQTAWQAGLDGRIAFYQMTDFGIVLAGTERSLYAIDGETCCSLPATSEAVRGLRRSI